MQSTQDKAEFGRVEAARYALLRRLALAMRHQMVVHLQPIGMITELMERRLKAPEPDLAQIGESMDKIHGFSKAAVEACLNVVTWLAPEPDARVELGAGIEECLALLRSNFSFRGFTLRSQVVPSQAEVSRAAVRTVLPAAMFALTDHAESPAELLVTAHVEGEQARMQVELRPGAGSEGFAANTPYRLLDWREVDALAQAEGASLSHGPTSARISLPLQRDEEPGR